MLKHKEKYTKIKMKKGEKDNYASFLFLFFRKIMIFSLIWRSVKRKYEKENVVKNDVMLLSHFQVT